MAIKINPMRIQGNWKTGVVLDFHIESSVFLGYDAFGHEQFDTKRTELGELIYRLKYKQEQAVLDDIVNCICIVASFRSIDVIIPVPPSKTSRRFQPVASIAEAFGLRIGVQVLPRAIRKIKNTPELKNVSTPEERYEILKNAFEVVDASIKGKTVLLLDDLYRSGATLRALTDILYKQGGVKEVKVLALTKTKAG